MMQRLKSFVRFSLIVSSMALFLAISLPVASAQTGILPVAPDKCVDVPRGQQANGVVKATKNLVEFKKYVTDNPNGSTSEVLGCAIKRGEIHLFMVPYFITYLTQFLLSIAGIISVLFVVIGGYKYAVGPIAEDKESGKKYIQYALIGLIVSLSAWIVVNFVLVALTS